MLWQRVEKKHLVATKLSYKFEKEFVKLKKEVNLEQKNKFLDRKIWKFVRSIVSLWKVIAIIDRPDLKSMWRIWVINVPKIFSGFENNYTDSTN